MLLWVLNLGFAGTGTPDPVVVAGFVETVEGIAVNRITDGIATTRISEGQR